MLPIILFTIFQLTNVDVTRACSCLEGISIEQDFASLHLVINTAYVYIYHKLFYQICFCFSCQDPNLTQQTSGYKRSLALRTRNQNLENIQRWTKWNLKNKSFLTTFSLLIFSRIKNSNYSNNHRQFTLKFERLLVTGQSPCTKTRRKT